MRRIRHLAWHDIKAQRVPLLAFLFVLSAEAALIVSGRTPQGRVSFVPWLPLVRLLITSVTAALIVQRDSLVGTTAFWQTRPIGRATLLASKLVSLTALLVAGPGLAAFAAWSATGLLPTDALTVASGVAVEQATVVLLTVMAAVVTPSFTHLIVAGVAGTTLVTLLNAVLMPALLTTWPFVGQSVGGDRPAVYILMLFALGLPAIAHQYLTLREWRTAALVGFALLGATGITRIWPAGEAGPPAVLDRSAVDPAKVVLTLSPGTLQASDWIWRVDGVDTRGTQYTAAVEADGYPAGVFLRAVAVESRLLLRDETIPFRTTGIPGGAINRPGPSDRMPAPRASLQHALGDARLPALRHQTVVPSRLTVATVPAAAERRNAGHRGILTTNVTVGAWTFRVRGAVPARPGSRLAVPGAAFEIVAVTLASPIVLTVRVSRVEVNDRTRWWMPVLCLRNASTREAYVLDQRDLWRGTMATVGMLRINAFRHVGMLRFSPDPNDAPPRPLDAAWLDAADLVYLEAEDLGAFTRPVQLEFVVGQTGR